MDAATTARPMAPQLVLVYGFALDGDGRHSTDRARPQDPLEVRAYHRSLTATFRLAAVVAVVALALVGAAGAAAASYYVSPSGNDAAAGTAPTAAWRSVSRVNTASLAPGDSVLFEGGHSFSGLLQPPASGSGGTPIVFASYGAGSANLTSGISLASHSWLTFRNLRVDTGDWRTAGSTRGVTTASSGTGVQNLVIEDCNFVNVAIGLLIQNRLDRFWTVRRNTIQYTRDSGILIYDPTESDQVGGSDMLFESNSMLDNGVDTTINYKKHAVYDIGTNLVWRNNVVRRFSEGGFSLRARGNTLEGNTISDGPYAIYHSPYDAMAGTTRIVYNKISNVTGAAMEFNSAGTTANVESYVIANNTIHASGAAPGIRLVGTAGSMTVENNLVVAESGYVVRIDKLPGGGYTAKNNHWYSTDGSASWAWLGTVYGSLAAYKAGSGHGSGDVEGDPRLDALIVPLVAPVPSVPLPPVPIAPLSNLVPSSDRPTSVLLGWDESQDARVVAYQVRRAGQLVAMTDLRTVSVSGLGCGGSYTFTVHAVDSSGTASAAISATGRTSTCPDTVKPALTITSPKNGQTAPRAFTITAKASDPSGIADVTFWFDGNAPCKDTTAPYASCSIKTTRGGHSIRVRATDKAGKFRERSIKFWAEKGPRP